MNTEPHPRIYVASLSDYNAGRLHGTWIDATDDLDTIWQQVHDMLRRSQEPGAEEWAIHDYEGFGPVSIDEYENIETVAQIAQGIARHGEAFAYWASHLGSSAWDELDRFEDVYLGSYPTLVAYAEELLDNFGINTDPDQWAPELIAPYVRFDLEAFAEDLHHMELIYEGQNAVHVFVP